MNFLTIFCRGPHFCFAPGLTNSVPGPASGLESEHQLEPFLERLANCVVHRCAAQGGPAGLVGRLCAAMLTAATACGHKLQEAGSEAWPSEGPKQQPRVSTTGLSFPVHSDRPTGGSGLGRGGEAQLPQDLGLSKETSTPTPKPQGQDGCGSAVPAYPQGLHGICAKP